MNEEKLDLVVEAIENLIDDMEYRRNPAGTWHGSECTMMARENLKEALRQLLTPHKDHERW